MRSGMTEIRQADLALDAFESAQLLEHIAGRSLSTDSVRALVTRTEGWAVGLQLAAMALRFQDDPDSVVIEFSGSDRLIADYLSEEVLAAESACLEGIPPSAQTSATRPDTGHQTRTEEGGWCACRTTPAIHEEAIE